MPLPITFGPLAGPIPTSNLDTNFAAVAAMGVLSCTAAGGNSLTLSPLGQQAIPLAYSNGQRFQFVAVISNTGAVSANIATLGSKPVFKDTTLGPVVCTGGEIVALNAYQLWFDAALNSGSGGFHLSAAGGTGSGSGSSGGGAFTFLAQQTVSGTAVPFVSGFSTSNIMYEMDFDSVQVTTDLANLVVQVSTNGGSTWITSGYTWIELAVANAITLTSSGSTSASGFTVGTLSSSTPVSGNMRFYGTQNTSGHVEMVGQFSDIAQDGKTYVLTQAGSVANSAVINAIQVIPSTGSFTSGTITLYALASSNGGSSGGSSGFTTAGVVGDARNFVCSFNTTTKLTITATEAIVKLAPGSSAFLGANLSFTLNFATTGQNGLDTGAIAANKFYGVYFIYNPTSNTFGTLASLNLTTPTTLPSGFTAYALMAVVPTDASAHIVAEFNCFGRTHSFQPINIFSGHAAVAALVSQSISAAVPPNGKTATGFIGTTGTGTPNVILVASDASNGFLQSSTMAWLTALTTPFPGSLVQAATFHNVPLTTAQVIYWAEENQGNVAMYITGFTI